jgi:serine/threonine-protein kinase
MGRSREARTELVAHTRCELDIVRDDGPQLGAVLSGRWRLARVLGAGGHATVYEAVHRNGRRVAIKIMHAALARSQRLRQRFLNEGHVTNRVEHDGAVAIHDDGELADGRPFLVMELLEGEMLAARIARARVSSGAEALSVADRLLDVLVSAHRAGVVHGDVKPGNVFVTSRGQLKLLDFGSVTGTPGFMAPEQARGHFERIDERADLWGVAATVFALLTCRAPHAAQSAEAAIAAAGTAPAPGLREHAAQLDRACADVLQRALASQPRDRWSSARAMRDALRRARPLDLSATDGGAPRSGASRSSAAARSGS